MSEDSQTTAIQQELIGEYIAQGFTNGQIVAELCKVGLTQDQAWDAVKHIYDTWKAETDRVNLQLDDERNWHQFLRMRLLQKALRTESVSAWQLALRILDSLATMQGITTLSTAPIPLPIMLVEAEEVPKDESNPG